ncbi:ribonuclease P protein component [Algimonas arctica]|uniref:Ribonuclease P protein component n=1 Tax=Algimonas arctica TaxID=1479486 RepID=A0A8J3CQU6_9PROT|nr:ribonuclease P protein component [Algimonas arctica]GHA87111.1 ribonuclease P protein component [Algimonas arctica]
MTQSQTLKLGTLRKRSEFLYVREGDYAARGAVVIQTRENPSTADTPHSDGPNAKNLAIRFGVTATKRIGNAVIRNRAKRRLRRVAHQLLPTLGRPGQDYVLIARDRTPTRDWDQLIDDATRALHSLPGPGQSPAKHSAGRRTSSGPSSP